MRPTIDETMLNIAFILSKRGTCLKKQVGAVALNKDKRLIAGAYNGAPKGLPHCDGYSPCLAYIDPSLSCMALHAEQNLFLHCDPKDVHTIYITEAPCSKCKMLIQNSSCKRVVWLEDDVIKEEIFPREEAK